MALVGIISTQLLDHLFVRRFPRGAIVEAENVKIYSIAGIMHQESPAGELSVENGRGAAGTVGFRNGRGEKSSVKDIAVLRRGRRSSAARDPVCRRPPGRCRGRLIEQLRRGVPPPISWRALFIGNTFYCTKDTLIRTRNKPAGPDSLRDISNGRKSKAPILNGHRDRHRVRQHRGVAGDALLRRGADLASDISGALWKWPAGMSRGIRWTARYRSSAAISMSRSAIIVKPRTCHLQPARTSRLRP